MDSKVIWRLFGSVLVLKKHVAAEEAFHLVERAGLLRFERHLAERRQIAGQIALHHLLAVGQPHGRHAHVVLPFRQAPIGEGADQDRLVLEGQRQRFLDDLPRVLRVRAEDAREEADIEAGAFRHLESAVLAEAADRRWQRHGLGLRAVFLDPALGDLGPGAICGGRRGGADCKSATTMRAVRTRRMNSLSMDEMPGGAWPDGYTSRS